MAERNNFSISTIACGKRDSLRLFLRKSWAETYSSELGEDVADALVKSLDSGDIGGVVPEKDEQVVVATSGNQILGSIVSAARHGITYLWGCYVLADFQRTGIGQALLLNAISTYDDTNTVQLTVLKSSTAALRFYDSLGFQTASEGSDELLAGRVFPSFTMTALTMDICRKYLL